MNASRLRCSAAAPADEHHQRPAHRLRVAREQRRGAVARELGGAEPLEQRVADRHERQAGQQRQALRQPQQDHQRGLVEHVVGVDVRRLVGEHRALPVGVEQRDELRVEHDDRLPDPDRHRVGERVLGQVEVGDVGEVERVDDLAVQHPDVRQLLLAEPHRGAERDGAQRPLVAELDQLAHDLVEVGDLAQRRGRGAVGRVLVGARGDALELVGADRERHAPGPYRRVGRLARRWRCSRPSTASGSPTCASATSSSGSTSPSPSAEELQGARRRPRPAPRRARGHDRVRPAAEARRLRRPRAVRLLHGAPRPPPARRRSSPSRSTSTSPAAFVVTVRALDLHRARRAARRARRRRPEGRALHRLPRLRRPDRRLLPHHRAARGAHRRARGRRCCSAGRGRSSSPRSTASSRTSRSSRAASCRSATASSPARRSILNLPGLARGTREYLRDIGDHLAQIAGELHRQQEDLTALTATYFNANANRLNSVAHAADDRRHVLPRLDARDRLLRPELRLAGRNIDTRHDFLIYGVGALVVPTLVIGTVFWVKRKDWF